MPSETDPKPATPAPKRRPPDWQGRLLPRSVLGITALILAAALGAAFSGAVLYAYYEYRLDTNNTSIDKYVTGFDKRLDTAVKIIDKERDDARSAVKQELEPLRQIAASGATISDLLKKTSPSVWFVATQGEDGAPSVGSAFVVFADADQSFLLTSFTTVKASTRKPSPAIELRKGDDHLEAELVTWEEGRDLALVSVKRGNLPALKWSTADPVVDPGERVFAVSGLGSQGGSVTQGLVSDVSGAGIQHDADVGPQFQGGPLVTSSGEVVGVASRTFAPLGFPPDAVWFAPPIRSACDKVLRCPAGGATGAGG
ncbi:MAG: putative serine protease [Actinomycetia bacterium]|nr:putative serine protease [Actinomycetes bacterium]